MHLPTWYRSLWKLSLTSQWHFLNGMFQNCHWLVNDTFVKVHLPTWFRPLCKLPVNDTFWMSCFIDRSITLLLRCTSPHGANLLIVIDLSCSKSISKSIWLKELLLQFGQCLQQKVHVLGLHLSLFAYNCSHTELYGFPKKQWRGMLLTEVEVLW